MKRLFALMAAALVALPGAAATARPAAEADKTDNVKLVAQFPYVNEEGDYFSGGTDIDFQGKWVYAMQQGKNGGVHVFQNTKGKPKKVSFIPCPGGQNDVAVVKPGLIALGYHSTQCAGKTGGGIMLIDVKNPKSPKYLGDVNNLPGGTHTLTTYPGKPIIYAQPGGLPTNGGGTQQIIDVSNPNKPEVAATFQPNRSGCHDLVFHFTKDEKLAFCAGFQETQIWDVSDALAPVTIARIHNPFTFFDHSIAVTHDGKYMVLGDENFGAHECRGGPTGAMFMYDITNRALPRLVSYFGLDRGPALWVGDPVGALPRTDFTGRAKWCTAHLFNFVPGTYKMVASWYNGGMNVIDWTDVSNPTEIAHYFHADANYWSAYWYDGKVWANDRRLGLDVFEVKGLKEEKHKHH